MTIVTRVAINEQNPWPGLGAFDEEAQRFFNGRLGESTELRRLVSSAPLAVLFGMSGLGKTSLLQAGLFPLLRRDHILPIYIRLDIKERRASFMEQAKDALEREFRERRVDAPAFTVGESVWEYLHRDNLELWSEQNQLLTPLFVFDQFEEVFTLGAERKQAIAQLKNDLSDLVENRLPSALAGAGGREDLGARYSLDNRRYKVLLSFREDFLPAVESWKQELPSILRNRLRLLPMSERQAFDAVHGTASHLASAAIAERIVAFVASAQMDGDAGAIRVLASHDELSVEPALLSLVCHGLNEKRKARRKAAFDDALLRETGPSIVAEYYQSVVGKLPNRVQEFIEKELITERGFRKSCDVDDAHRLHGVSDEELQLLVGRRLLRIEPARGTDRVELTHDLLTRVVREHRDRRRQQIRKRRNRTRAILAAVALIAGAVAAETWRDDQTMKREQQTKQARDSAQADTLKTANRSLSLARDSLSHAVVAERAARDTADLAQQRALESSHRAQVEAQRATTIAVTLDTLIRILVDSQQLRRMSIEDRQRDLDSLRARLQKSTRHVDSVKWNDSINAVTRTFDSLRNPANDPVLQSQRASARARAFLANTTLIPFDSYTRLDVFDVSRGVVILGPASQSLQKPIFGDSSADTPQSTGVPGFVGQTPRVVIEFETPRDVRLQSVAVFAQHAGRDGRIPLSSPRRAFRELTLSIRARRVRDSASAWTPVARFNPTLPYGGPDAYSDDQPARSLSICLPVLGNIPGRAARNGAVGRHFRLEVIAAGSASDPGIVELDGFSEDSCGAPPPSLVAGISGETERSQLERDYRASTIAISMVLQQLHAGAAGGGAGRGDSFRNSVRFLARTDPKAWNQQQARMAGMLLRDRRSDGAPIDSLSVMLKKIVPALDSLVDIDVAAERAPAALEIVLSDTASDSTVLATLEAFRKRHRVPDVPQRLALRNFLTKLQQMHRLVSDGLTAESISSSATVSLASKRTALQRYLSRLDTARAGKSADRERLAERFDNVQRQIAAERVNVIRGNAASVVASPESTLARKRTALQRLFDALDPRLAASEEQRSSDALERDSLLRSIKELQQGLHFTASVCAVRSGSSCATSLSPAIAVQLNSSLFVTVRYDTSSRDQQDVLLRLFRQNMLMTERAIPWERQPTNASRIEFHWPVAGDTGSWTLRLYDTQRRLVYRFPFRVVPRVSPSDAPAPAPGTLRDIHLDSPLSRAWSRGPLRHTRRGS
ncbi:MAG: nSTAND1 domain-containing NTPase [Gemmatimonadaceae bacterium]